MSALSSYPTASFALAMLAWAAAASADPQKDPSSIEDYDERVAELRHRKPASDAEKDDIRRKRAALDRWYEHNVTVHDPAQLAGGVVLVVLGAGLLIGGPIVIAVGALKTTGPCFSTTCPSSGSTDGTTMGGVAMMVGGGLLAVIGIPLILSGSERELKTSLRIGPANIALQGAF